MSDPIDIARRCYQAYIDGDRAAIEPLIAEDFTFTSPRDNRIDRATYFERCWPNHHRLQLRAPDRSCRQRDCHL